MQTIRNVCKVQPTISKKNPFDRDQTIFSSFYLPATFFFRDRIIFCTLCLRYFRSYRHFFVLCTRDTEPKQRESEREREKERKRERDRQTEIRRVCEIKSRDAFSFYQLRECSRYSPTFFTVLLIDLCFLANLSPRELQDVLT